MICLVLSLPIPEPSLFSIAFYLPSKKTILDWGSSRACGCNCNKMSIHAEQIAMNFCNSYNKKKNKLEIYIWRYDINGNLKSTYCCNACTKLMTKYNYINKIYTFNSHNKIISAITDNPQISLGWKIIHDL